MLEVSTVGIDLAKNVIQIHGVDTNVKTMVRSQLQRSQSLAFFESQHRCTKSAPDLIIYDMIMMLFDA